MKLAAGISLLGLGFLLGFSLGDTPVKAEVLPQGDCDPDRVQVIHTDNSRQMTVVLDRGVQCVTILEGIR